MTTPPLIIKNHNRQPTLITLVTNTTAKDIQCCNLITLCGTKGDDNMTPKILPAIQ